MLHSPLDAGGRNGSPVRSRFVTAILSARSSTSARDRQCNTFGPRRRDIRRGVPSMIRQATVFSEVRAARGHPAVMRATLPLRVVTSGIAPKVLRSLAPAPHARFQGAARLKISRTTPLRGTASSRRRVQRWVVPVFNALVPERGARGDRRRSREAGRSSECAGRPRPCARARPSRLQ